MDKLFCETLSQKTLHKKERAGGVAQGIGSEFNLSTTKKRKKERREKREREMKIYVHLKTYIQMLHQYCL
jgi:hypothetical protein